MTDSENGYKFELYLHDALPHVGDAKLGILTVDRQAEFAPVKNCESIGHDTPSQAVDQILAQHGKWLQNVNGLKIDYSAQNKIEVSPLLSYDGENLAWLKNVFRKTSLDGPGGYIDQ